MSTIPSPPAPLLRRRAGAIPRLPSLPVRQSDLSRFISYRRSAFPGFRTISRANSALRILPIVRAGLAPIHPLTDAPEDADADAEVVFSETFPVKRVERVEGKVKVKFERASEEDGSAWRVTVGCDLEGKWVLHWGVTYCDDPWSEWDQPPLQMRPPDSIPIKDYAIETPLKKSPSASEGQILHEVRMDIDSSSPIAAIHFVLKDDETGAWFQHKGRDFRIPLKGYLEEDYNVAGGKKSFNIWPGAFNQISSLLLKPERSHSKSQETIGESKGTSDSKHENRHFAVYHEEFSFLKEDFVQNYMTVTVKKNKDTEKSLVHFDTDIPGDVVVHWGVCKDKIKKWEIPSTPHPPATKHFRQKALQTLLQPKLNGHGNWGLFPVDKEISGVLFVLKLNGMWLNNVGNDFYIPLISLSSSPSQTSSDQTMNEKDVMFSLKNEPSEIRNLVTDISSERSTEETKPAVDQFAYTDEIINEIRNLVTDISSERSIGTKTKEAQESILQEIEILAAEAYSIFRSSSVNFVDESVLDDKSLMPAVKPCSGTGSGYEILCQGFNWESHKSGRWYSELNAKASELSSLGFTVVWLPPPTESVSPEGYMPKDLYNLNSRYGSMEELKDVVNKFHEVGIKVLGDVVLNHRCAHYQNKNGIWNIFGGRLNWDDRAVVADDPHFQGRGNKSSGDSFHAAPNIDHSQDFVRKDLIEWLCWLRKEVGYDGWRLDFVRGFWGGYVKDYLEATEPYFSVGEYWDSLSYTYGEMDHNQDAHRQRIVDWINATNGTAGAFDVTTKGILHAALEKCEYWRLSDQKGKPPGVLGWWPSRAVTFIENHDTGSTQGHWRFPSGKEMQGYAYILTHPGTPAVFYDHIFSHYHQEISRLISLRHRTKIHCRSLVKIIKAERDVYAAEIDEKIAVKIGPGYYEPASGPKKWNLAAEGRDYKVWEAL